MPKVDFTGVTDSFEPIPAGRYNAVLTGFKNNIAKSSNQPFITLEFTVSEDPEWSGRKVWQNNSLQPQSLWVLKRNCIALGADPETLGGELDTDELLGDLIGSECRLDVDVREYEGRTNNSVESIYSAYDL